MYINDATYNAVIAMYVQNTQTQAGAFFTFCPKVY